MLQSKHIEWMNGYKNKYHKCCLQETHCRSEETHRLKVEFHANGKEKKGRVVILISDKLYFKTKTVRRGKEGHYIMINESI